MAILGFLVELLGAAMLLLFAVQFLRVRIERLWGDRLGARLERGRGGIVAMALGAVAAVILQGATVVMLMAAGMARSKALPAGRAALAALGADFGSALVVLLLSFPVGALSPLLVLVGGWLHLNSARNVTVRNVGGALLALGLILLSLTLIRAAVAPLGESEELDAVLFYLGVDPVSALLAGLVLALVMHSSVAAILTIVAISASGHIGIEMGLGFLLGANLGSAVLPLWLLRSSRAETGDAKTGGASDPAWDIAISVGALRAAAVLVALACLAVLPVADAIPESTSVARTILVAHLAFNAALLPGAPVVLALLRAMQRRAAGTPRRASTLAEPMLPEVLPVRLRRDVAAMLDRLLEMYAAVWEDPPARAEIERLEAEMNAALSDCRRVFSSGGFPAERLAEAQRLMEYAIRIERCGDLVATRLLQFRAAVSKGTHPFTEDGQSEIAELAGQVRLTMLLAHDTLAHADSENARGLVRRKERVSELEATSRGNHLRRIRGGSLKSLASSDLHLETIAMLKEINSKVATLGYAVLESGGGLIKSRVIE